MITECTLSPAANHIQNLDCGNKDYHQATGIKTRQLCIIRWHCSPGPSKIYSLPTIPEQIVAATFTTSICKSGIATYSDATILPLITVCFIDLLLGKFKAFFPKIVHEHFPTHRPCQLIGFDITHAVLPGQSSLFSTSGHSTVSMSHGHGCLAYFSDRQTYV